MANISWTKVKPVVKTVILAAACMAALIACGHRTPKSAFTQSFENLTQNLKSLELSLPMAYTHKQELADWKVLTTHPDLPFLKQAATNDKEPYAQQAAMRVLLAIDKPTLTKVLPEVIAKQSMLFSLHAESYLSKLDSDQSTKDLSDIIKFDKRYKVVRFAVILSKDVSAPHKKVVARAVDYRLKVSAKTPVEGSTFVIMLKKGSKRSGLKLATASN